MDESLRQYLRELVDEHGSSALRNPEWLQAALVRQFPGRGREAELFTAAIPAGIAAHLVGLRGSYLDEHDTGWMTDALAAQGFPGEEGLPAIRDWAFALRVPFFGEDPTEGVVSPVRCSRKGSLFFVRIVRTGDGRYVPVEALAENANRLPEVDEFPSNQGNRSLVETLLYAESFSSHIPQCPHCSWTYVHQCPRCRTTRCAPRDGYVFMGNGCTLGKPERSERFRLACPACGEETPWEHTWYSDREGSPYMAGDPPVLET